MPVQTATVPAVPSIPPSPGTALVHIRTDPHSGRNYHASYNLSENADLVGVCTPYSYTIWKRFRNEVCAECWRYDGGRRVFLTRRDDDGLKDIFGTSAPVNNTHDRPAAKHGRTLKAISSTGAGLWFCNAECQYGWIAREGIDAVELLRRLEGARQRKMKAPPKVDADARRSTEREITQEVADRVWDIVRERERSPKELRRWQDLQLDDYETDMARYVLLALLRCHREQGKCIHRCHCHPSCCPCEKDENGQTLPGATQRGAERDTSPNVHSKSTEGYEQSSEWRTFSSLQTNELSLLRACPEILEHQTRIYQLLKGRFGSKITVQPVSESASRSSVLGTSSPNGIRSSTHKDVGMVESSDNSGCWWQSSELGDVITIENVRTILGVDPGNSFGIWEVPLMEESECLGFAVYPIGSFFNHHCSPNVRKEREGHKLRFMTSCSVCEGEELCISYGHVESMSWADRQQELMEGWYFRCRCSRCMTEERDRTL